MSDLQVFDKLSPRQEVFVREYLTDLDPQRAAIAAGYSPKSAHVNAYRLLDNARVLREIERQRSERLARIGVRADSVLTELATLGYSNMLDYVQPQEDGSVVTDLSTLDRKKAAALQEVTIDEYMDGKGDEAREVKRVKIKLAPKRDALELLGKHLKLFTERTEVTGAGGGPVRMIVIDLTAEIKTP